MQLVAEMDRTRIAHARRDLIWRPFDRQTCSPVPRPLRRGPGHFVDPKCPGCFCGGRGPALADLALAGAGLLSPRHTDDTDAKLSFVSVFISVHPCVTSWFRP